MRKWLIIPVCAFCIISMFMFVQDSFFEVVASDGNEEIIYNDKNETATAEDGEEVDTVLLVLGLALMIGFIALGVVIIVAVYYSAIIILSFFIPTGEKLENASEFVKFLSRIVQRRLKK